MNALSVLKSYRYEIVAFLTGAAVMVLELVGTRLIAPVFGTSTYVWTAMIGVILASLAIGFTVGGKLADRYHSTNFLGFILLIAALLVLGIGLFQQSVLENIAAFNFDLRIGALFAAILLFALPSALIGMVSPHLAKMSVTSLADTGRAIGRLEAAGALGSIAGTFSCGYFLLGAFGSRSIVIGIVVLLLITSFIADPNTFRKIRLFSFLIVVGAASLISVNPPSVLADIDSSYARYRVVKGTFEGKYVNMLTTDTGGIQSASLRSGSTELALPYTRQFMQAAQAYGTPARVLVVGGGTYTFPAALAATFPNIHVDAVEIDPALDRLAKDYFFYKDSPQITIHHADGRMYLNTNKTKYDIIYMDAYSSLSPPFQLSTVQTAERIKASLAPNGVVVVNLIGRYEAGNGEYLRALQATYGSVFQNITLSQTQTDIPVNAYRQNFMLFASNGQKNYDKLVAGNGRQQLALAGGGRLLTDNYAPIERLTY